MDWFHQGFNPSPIERDRPHPVRWGWLCLSLMAPLYYGLLAIQHAFSQRYVVQDDARIHIVWLQRFVDPQLFTHDVIADYYSAIQSVGFQWVYGLMAHIGITPLVFAKLLPLGLAIIATVYLFHVAHYLLPVPMSGVLVALIFNQNIWLKDDLVSATPRAFVYPLFAAFLYYLVRRSPLPCLMTIFLQGLFYPQLMLVEVGILTLRLIHWKGLSAKRSRQSTYAVWLGAIAIVGFMLLVFSSGVSNQVGDLVTAEQMKAMPEFQPEGRREYFGVHPIQFWFSGASGLRFPLFPPIIGIGVLLPWFAKARSPLAQHLTRDIRILGQCVIASLGLFGAAHLLFPTLYLPSRYTFYSLRVVMAIATGIVLTILLDRLRRWVLTQRQQYTRLPLYTSMKIWLMGLLAIAIVVVPAIPAWVIPCQGWVIGTTPSLYQFLAQQPNDTLIASLTAETNNIPAFAQRSVLVSEELALPYHPEFYTVMTQRIRDTLAVQYSPDLSTVQSLLNTYGIDYLIVDRDFQQPLYLSRQHWLLNSSIRAEVRQVKARLEQGQLPAIAPLLGHCSVFAEKNLIALDAACITRIKSN
ncbi:MAG: hypothetical protein ACFE0J_03740 [Elainellaceae cyanobacterium]